MNSLLVDPWFTTDLTVWISLKILNEFIINRSIIYHWLGSLDLLKILNEFIISRSIIYLWLDSLRLWVLCPWEHQAEVIENCCSTVPRPYLQPGDLLLHSNNKLLSCFKTYRTTGKQYFLMAVSWTQDWNCLISSTM